MLCEGELVDAFKLPFRRNSQNSTVIAVLTAAGEAVVVVAKNYVAQLDALGGLVIANPGRIENQHCGNR